jgi:putative glutamine amidotransferase
VRPPRIGLSCSPLRDSAYYDPYQRALAGAGAEVVRLSAHPGGGSAAAATVAGLDGVLLPGGWDVDPGEYGGDPALDTLGTPDAREARASLDRTEIALIRAALDAGRPILGICRGQQVVNVALGGALHQHVDGHTEPGRPRNHLAHPVEIVDGSELARIAGPRPLMVNSTHHQAVSRVAGGLRVTARSPEGIVEGLETDDLAVVTVQWHPEELVAEHGWARDFFAAYVARLG